MNESIFEQSLKNREKEQEKIKAANGLKSKAVPEKINLSLPADCKAKYLAYCKNHYISPSAQLRQWIDQYCNE